MDVRSERVRFQGGPLSVWAALLLRDRLFEQRSRQSLSRRERSRSKGFEIDMLNIAALLQLGTEDAVPTDAAAVLLLSSRPERTTEPGREFWTVAGTVDDELHHGPSHDDQVAWVRKRAGGVFARQIGVGRTANNDIVLPFEDISKYHACFALDETGKVLSVEDAASSNGTFVNGLPIKARVPVPIRSGDTLRFAGHSALFMARADFGRLLHGMAR